jgi:GNAT superfamily N-acetyltransferase
VETGDVLRPGAADASVRPARPADVPALADVQVRAWQQAYADLLPRAVLDALTAEQLDPHWRRAVSEPPSARHAVFVACAGPAVVGFAATAPCGDPDASPTDGELVALEVDPAHRGSGHGSRLLAASADTLREMGFETIRSWCPDGDPARAEFLSDAGLRSDGAWRELRGPDGSQVSQRRMAAALPQ